MGVVFRKSEKTARGKFGKSEINFAALQIMPISRARAGRAEKS
jgi:hypothetical protein